MGRKRGEKGRGAGEGKTPRKLWEGMGEREKEERKEKARKNACAGPILKRNTIFYRYFLTTDGVINGRRWGKRRRKEEGQKKSAVEKGGRLQE